MYQQRSEQGKINFSLSLVTLKQNLKQYKNSVYFGYDTPINKILIRYKGTDRLTSDHAQLTFTAVNYRISKASLVTLCDMMSVKS